MQQKPITRRSILRTLFGVSIATAIPLLGCNLASAEQKQTSSNGSSNDQQQAKGKQGKRMTDTQQAEQPAVKEFATLGAGCFWCVEAVFLELKGVEKVVSGYSGGQVKNPTYEEVCTGATGHAEVVQITFDPKVISFSNILRVFFTTHDPTTLNQQGPDYGTQYRSAVFYHSTAQKETAEKVIKEITAEKLYANPIVTEVTPYSAFYAAEAYHQNYYAQNPNQGYCRVVIEPKVRKFREKYRAMLKK